MPTIGTADQPLVRGTRTDPPLELITIIIITLTIEITLNVTAPEPREVAARRHPPAAARAPDGAPAVRQAGSGSINAVYVYIYISISLSLSIYIYIDITIHLCDIMF